MPITTQKKYPLTRRNNDNSQPAQAGLRRSRARHFEYETRSIAPLCEHFARRNNDAIESLSPAWRGFFLLDALFGLLIFSLIVLYISPVIHTLIKTHATLLHTQQNQSKKDAYAIKAFFNKELGSTTEALSTNLIKTVVSTGNTDYVYILPTN